MGEIKELADAFDGIGEVKGFRFRKLLSNGYAYLYSVHGGADRVYYEVFERRINALYGVVRYPRSKHFGVWAKTTYDWDRALAYYGEFTMRAMSRNEDLNDGF